MRVIDHFLTAIFFGGGIWGESFISSQCAVLCCHSKLRPVFGSRIQRKRIQNQIFTTHPWWRKHGAFKCRGAQNTKCWVGYGGMFQMFGCCYFDLSKSVVQPIILPQVPQLDISDGNSLVFSSVKPFRLSWYPLVN